MEGIPGFSIPAIISHLQATDLARCACVSRDWSTCVQFEPFANKVAVAKVRAEMPEDQRNQLDKDVNEAACRGNLDDLQDLIAEGAHVDARNKSQWTGLMLAAFYGHPTVVKELLAQGADVNALNNKQQTALMLASIRNHQDIVVALIESGARPDIKNVRGKTALIHAEDLEFCKIVEILTASSA